MSTTHFAPKILHQPVYIARLLAEVDDTPDVGPWCTWVDGFWDGPWRHCFDIHQIRDNILLARGRTPVQDPRHGFLRKPSSLLAPAELVCLGKCFGDPADEQVLREVSRAWRRA